MKVKQLLGRPLKSTLSNIKREEYNQLIRSAFPKELVFDLARIESTRPDGKPENHPSGTNPVPALLPDYTYDGGHLNALGMKVVAVEFLNFLAAQNLPAPPSPATP
jgi:hypothetical protein